MRKRFYSGSDETDSPSTGRTAALRSRFESAGGSARSGSSSSGDGASEADRQRARSLLANPAYGAGSPQKTWARDVLYGGRQVDLYQGGLEVNTGYPYGSSHRGPEPRPLAIRYRGGQDYGYMGAPAVSQTRTVTGYAPDALTASGTTEPVQWQTSQTTTVVPVTQGGDPAPSRRTTRGSLRRSGRGRRASGRFTRSMSRSRPQ